MYPCAHVHPCVFLSCVNIFQTQSSMIKMLNPQEATSHLAHIILSRKCYANNELFYFGIHYFPKAVICAGNGSVTAITAKKHCVGYA